MIPSLVYGYAIAAVRHVSALAGRQRGDVWRARRTLAACMDERRDTERRRRELARRAPAAGEASPSGSVPERSERPERWDSAERTDGEGCSLGGGVSAPRRGFTDCSKRNTKRSSDHRRARKGRSGSRGWRHVAHVRSQHDTTTPSAQPTTSTRNSPMKLSMCNSSLSNESVGCDSNRRKNIIDASSSKCTHELIIAYYFYRARFVTVSL